MSRSLHVVTGDESCRMTFVRVGDLAGVELDIRSPGAVEYAMPSSRQAAIRRCLRTERDFVTERCQKVLGELAPRLTPGDGGRTLGHDDEVRVGAPLEISQVDSSVQLSPGRRHLVAATTVREDGESAAVCRGLVRSAIKQYRRHITQSLRQQTASLSEGGIDSARLNSIPQPQ